MSCSMEKAAFGLSPFSYLHLYVLVGWYTPKAGEGNGTPLQYFCLENPMNRGAWWAAVHGVAKSWTWLSDFTLTFHFHALEKEMATHFSILAQRIPGMGEPVGLPSMGSHRVRHDWSDLAAAAAAGTSCKWKHTALVLLCLTYFTSMMSPQFIHVVSCVRIFFLFKDE